MPAPRLLAVPNVSEGRDASTIAALRSAFAAEGTRMLDVHSDPDHHRSVYTIAGPPQALADAVLAGARAVLEHIDLMRRADDESAPVAQHPYVGALDVAPIVYLDERSRGAACAEALVIADRIGEELAVPVFLYGELTADDSGEGRPRAELRRGGVSGLAQRIAGGSTATSDEAARAQRVLTPDFGPPSLHPSAGATLVAARPPLVAFNVRLAPSADMRQAQRIAAAIREGGTEGLPGLRAIAVSLSGGAAQISMNVERPLDVPLAKALAAVSANAQVASAEIVGLVPRAALEGFPQRVPIVGFDPERQVIENALGW